MMLIAQIFLTGIALYAFLGACFATAFVLRGLGRVDPVAKHAAWPVRLILWPGSLALWPILLRRWLGAARRGAAA